MWKATLPLVLCALSPASASADINDEKPWDWKSLESYMLRTSDGTGKCDAVAEDHHLPDLKCSIDHKSWDEHLAKEAKIERVRNRNQQQPSNCDNGVFQFFRKQGSNGGYPDVPAVQQELGQKVALLTCTFDDVDKNPFVTYDAGHKNLVMHLTRKEIGSGAWLKAELRTPQMVKLFPLLERAYRKYE